MSEEEKDLTLDERIALSHKAEAAVYFSRGYSFLQEAYAKIADASMMLKHGFDMGFIPAPSISQLVREVSICLDFFKLYEKESSGECASDCQDCEGDSVADLDKEFHKVDKDKLN